MEHGRRKLIELQNGRNEFGDPNESAMIRCSRTYEGTDDPQPVTAVRIARTGIPADTDWSRHHYRGRIRWPRPPPASWTRARAGVQQQWPARTQQDMERTSDATEADESGGESQARSSVNATVAAPHFVSCPMQEVFSWCQPAVLLDGGESVALASRRAYHHVIVPNIFVGCCSELNICGTAGLSLRHHAVSY